MNSPIKFLHFASLLFAWAGLTTGLRAAEIGIALQAKIDGKIAAEIAGGRYAALRTVERDIVTRTARVLAAKNIAYQTLESVVGAQAGLHNSLRLKDPDEIEKSREDFKHEAAAVKHLIQHTAELSPAIGEKLTALLDLDQQAIDQFRRGERCLWPRS